MDTLEGQLTDSLFASVTTFAQTLSPVLEVSFDGVELESKPQLYLAAFHLPAETQNYGIDKGFWLLGNLQISVMLLTGTGITAASDIAGKIAEYYNKGLVIGPVKTFRRPYVSPKIETEGRINIPVTIPYRGFYDG